MAAGMKNSTAIIFLALAFFAMGANSTFATFNCNEGEIIRCSDTNNYYQYSNNCLVKIQPWTGIFAHHNCNQNELPTNKWPIKDAFCPRFNDNDFAQCGHNSNKFQWKQSQIHQTNGIVGTVNRGVWATEFLDKCNQGNVFNIVESLIEGIFNLFGSIFQFFKKQVASFNCNEGEIVRCSDTNNYYQYSKGCLVKITPWAGIFAHHTCTQDHLPTNRYPIKQPFCPTFSDRDFCKSGKSGNVYQWQQGPRQLCEAKGNVGTINKGVWAEEFIGQCAHGQPFNV